MGDFLLKERALYFSKGCMLSSSIHFEVFPFSPSIVIGKKLEEIR